MIQNRYTLHVPLQRNDGTPVTDAEIHGIETDLLSWAKGFTATDGVGGWKSEDGTIYREPVRVYAVDAPASQSNWERLTSLAQFIATALEQEAVYTAAARIHPALIASVAVTS